jgi:hypothetical protein
MFMLFYKKNIFRFTSTGFVPVTVVGRSTRDNGWLEFSDTDKSVFRVLLSLSKDIKIVYYEYDKRKWTENY